MKATLHFPTEQYGFAEVEMEVDSVEEALDAYRAAKQVGPGLDKKAYDAFLERQLLGESNHIEEYLKMNEEQQMIVLTIKRALKRIAYKNQTYDRQTTETWIDRTPTTQGVAADDESGEGQSSS